MKIVRSDCGTGWLIVDIVSGHALSPVFRSREQAESDLRFLRAQAASISY